MTSIPWTKEFPASMIVCDTEGVILDMNDQAASLFAKAGGLALLGRNLLDCHPEPSRTKLREMLASAQTNVYTMDLLGAKRLVYQAPWYEEGQYRGLVEIVLDLPDPLPHIARDVQG